MVNKSLNMRVINLMTKLQNDLTESETRLISNVLYSATQRIKVEETLENI